MTLGRIKSKDAVASLKFYSAGALRLGNDPLVNACAWAVSQISGEPLITKAEPTPVRRPFLIPND